MRINLDTPFCQAAVNEIFVDGVLQNLCIGADDVEGVVERYVVNELGQFIYDKDGGDVITEVLTGKVKICLNKGWSFKNNRFFLDPVAAGTYWEPINAT